MGIGPLILPDAEQAWIVEEWASLNRRQCDIAAQIGLNSPNIISIIEQFCIKYEGVDPKQAQIYNNDRKRLALNALAKFLSTGQDIQEPKKRDDMRDERIYREAVAEHVILLRDEGLTLKQIGARIGVSVERVRGIECHFFSCLRNKDPYPNEELFCHHWAYVVYYLHRIQNKTFKEIGKRLHIDISRVKRLFKFMEKEKRLKA